jgi:2-polyprenyl-3-methyl-5-hydroxy-6-metoxy-1,4-benzoquinol methylase
MWPRSIDAREQMDDPDCDEATLRRTYAAFRYVNPVVAGWRRTYRERIRPRLSHERPMTLLDVGCGGGDLASSLAGWALREGLRLEVTGIDPDARAIAVAREAAPRRASNAVAAGTVTFTVARAEDLDDASFDLVVSNHVLHHLTDLPAFLAATAAVCVPGGGLVLHSDLRRSRIAYAAFGIGMLPFFRDTFIRADGLTSITRSYTREEARRAVPAGWAVATQWPYRLLLIHHA